MTNRIEPCEADTVKRRGGLGLPCSWANYHARWLFEHTLQRPGLPSGRRALANAGEHVVSTKFLRIER